MGVSGVGKRAELRTENHGVFASKPVILGRSALALFVTTVMLILARNLMPLLWFGLQALSFGFQVATSRRNPGAGRVRSLRFRDAFILADAVMFACAAAVIRNYGTPISMECSLIILMVVSLYSLMYFYTRPRFLLLITLPYLVSFGYFGFKESAEAVARSHFMVAVVPIIEISLLVYFLAQTRRQLDRARSKLVAARSEAVSREQDARVASQAKSDFLATIGHEIRTPLNGVLGIAQVMENRHLPADQREHLKIIAASGQALLDIVNDLLDFSKIEAGKLELDFSAFSLAELSKGAHATFAAAADLKEISFGLSIAPRAYGAYHGDSARLRQVMHNLISNAVKFTERGGVDVIVDYENGELTVTVRDTGIGVPAHRIAVLCERFTQADASTTRRYGGTGLGLAIVCHLLALMNGRLEIESEEGQGSTFKILVPLSQLADDGGATLPVQPPGPAAMPLDSAASFRVLAAEDNPTNRIVLQAILQQIGISPHFVVNGLEAVKAWEAEAWDLILMDVQMPLMDGPAAAKAIRRSEATSGRPLTPIIALTANAMTHQRMEYLASGMSHVVAKPVQAALLFQAMEEAIAEAELSNEQMVSAA